MRVFWKINVTKLPKPFIGSECGIQGASQEEKCPDGNFYFTLRMSEPGDQREGEEQEEDYFERRCIATIRSLSVDDIMMLTNWLLAELRRRSEGGDREGGILNPE